MTDSANPPAEVTYPVTSTSAIITTDLGDMIGLTYERLDSKEIISAVKDDGAGAIAVFIGTTRDSFQGKKVTRLTYEAYTPLCIKTIKSILLSARALPNSTSTPSHSLSAHSLPHSPVSGQHLTRLAVHHRLGEVPVGESSIIIAVSSPHRREAFEACEFILEEVKKKAQIWKREWYADDGEGGDHDAGGIGRDGEAVERSGAAWKENFPSKA